MVHAFSIHTLQNTPSNSDCLIGKSHCTFNEHIISILLEVTQRRKKEGYPSFPKYESSISLIPKTGTECTIIKV